MRGDKSMYNIDFLVLKELIQTGHLESLLAFDQYHQKKKQKKPKFFLKFRFNQK